MIVKGVIMQNLQINDSLSFRGLNYHNVSGIDRNIIRKDLKQLRQLGKEYDIRFLRYVSERKTIFSGKTLEMKLSITIIVLS